LILSISPIPTRASLSLERVSLPVLLPYASPLFSFLLFFCIHVLFFPLHPLPNFLFFFAHLLSLFLSPHLLRPSILFPDAFLFIYSILSSLIHILFAVLLFRPFTINQPFDLHHTFPVR
jgi:hypothetical protein